MSDSGLTEIRSQEVPCPDPDCGGMGEPDQDGDHLFYECKECGYQFGWDRVPQPAHVGDGAGGSCQIGVPESVRRAASKHMEGAIAGLDDTLPLEPPSTPVTLTRKER